MTHIEFLNKLINDFKDEFKNKPSNDKEIIAYRQGIIFAYKYAIELLKNPENI